MATRIVVPPSGQTTDEVRIIRWHKTVGDQVNRGDLLFEIETDKAVMEIESYAHGTILAICSAEGETVSVGDVVAYVGNQCEKVPVEIEGTEDEYTPILAATGCREQSEISEKPSTRASTGEIEGLSLLLASPAARWLAKSKNIELRKVAQSTSKSVIKREHVATFLEQTSEVTGAEYYELEVPNMRRTIARRMVENAFTIPHYTVSIDIDMTKCIALRLLLNDYVQDSGVKISFNDILMKCASSAIQTYSLINSTFEDQEIRVYKNVNFGLAVSVDGGLVVPVVRKVNNKSLLDIARGNSANVDKAKQGKLNLTDMSGGTITLSNLGMYGIDRFTAIINKPESCILAVGQISEKAISRNGQIVSKQMVNVTASFDHRVIDGAYGARFLQQFAEFVANPELLLV